MRTTIGAAILFAAVASSVTAQNRFFAGAVTGVATLSADAIFDTKLPAASGYKPANGPAVSPFAGVHVNDFLSFQVSYLWNRNAVTFYAIQGTAHLEQASRAGQQLVIADALVYFRSRSSRLRPFLGVGIGGGRLSTQAAQASGTLGPAPGNFTTYLPVLNVPVGIDIRLHRGWRFRYSFAETIQRNPLSTRLLPPGERGLKGFRNFFGILKEF